MEVDWDNFNFIAGKIDDGIWQIPPDDQKYYNDIRRKIEELVTIDEAFDYVTNEMSMELMDYILEHRYDEIREHVLEQEAQSRQH